MALPVGRIENAELVLGPASKREPLAAQTVQPPQDFFSLDAKTQLERFCQRKLGRTLQFTDIKYMTERYPQGFQCIVRMNCIDGQEFAGELRPESKKAEEAAATQAMLVYKAEAMLLGLNADSGKRKAVAPPVPKAPEPKRVRMDPGVIGMPGLVPPQSADPTLNNKSELATNCARIARKIMDKTDILFETKEVDEGGFQAVLRLKCLPGVWSTRSFVGQVCRKKAEAEQSTAGVALAAIKNDPFLMSKLNEPPKVKTVGPRIGKGQGRGKGGILNAPMTMNVPPLAAQGFAYPPHLQALAIPGIPQTGFWG